MGPLAADTPVEVEAIQSRIWRELPEARRLRLVFDLIETGRALALAGIRVRHPDASPEEVRRRFADLVLGPELAEKVYGPAASRAGTGVRGR